jgi:AcrR family transcriptional regulator
MTPETRQPDPRANQKERTRQAIVEAARQLQRQGVEPSVARAAEAARVSRATAYRYFPTQDALLLEVEGITPLTAPVEELVANLTSADAETRLLALLDALNGLVIAEETRMRRALFVYQDTWLRGHRDGSNNATAVREGRRMRLLDAVLEPLRALPVDQYQRLRAALALTLGADSIVVMKDVCALDDAAALEVLRWSAITLLRAATQDTQPRG